MAVESRFLSLPSYGMGIGYNPGAWTTLYNTVATSAAALAGLLFIALSMNLARILPDAAHVARAREALGSLLALFILGLLVLIPGQGRVWLGWELLLLGVTLGGVSIRLQGQTLRRLGQGRRRRWALRVLPLNVGTVALTATGITLVAGRGGGLFWLVPTVLIYFFWAVMNAWILLVGAAPRHD